MQGYDSNENVVYTVTNSSGVVAGSQKDVARRISGKRVAILTRNQISQRSDTNSHYGEQ